MEPKDWIAVAQVYATLAQTNGVVSSGLTFTNDKDFWINQARIYKQKSCDALRAAGVEDA